MSIGPSEFGIIVIVSGVIPLVLGIWTAIDASRHPDWAFDAARTSKTLWIVLPLAGVFACGLVAIVAWLVWLSSVRPRVVAAAAATPPQSPFVDGPPSGWAPPGGPPPGTSPAWPPPPPPGPPEQSIPGEPPPEQRPPDPG